MSVEACHAVILSFLLLFDCVEQETRLPLHNLAHISELLCSLPNHLLWFCIHTSRGLL